MTLILKPKSIEQLKEMLGKATSRRPVTAFDLSRIAGVRQHTPEDLTATVAAGTTLADLQSTLRSHGQWLPLDPPRPTGLSIGGLIAGNASGPHRYGLGTVRDYLIGIKVVLGNGSESNSGGRVVKNVAGFDLPKLFVGSRGSLGVILEATFKLAPLPEARLVFEVSLENAEELVRVGRRLLDRGLSPCVLDGHRMARGKANASAAYLVVGFVGSKDEVTDQGDRLQSMLSARPATLDYQDQFWQVRGKAGVEHDSVLPSELGDRLQELKKEPWVARVGNGVIYYRTSDGKPAREPTLLERRLKEAFDPRRILPPIP